MYKPELRQVGSSGGSNARRLCVLFHPRCGSSWLLSTLAGNRTVFARYEILDVETAIRDRFLAPRDYPFIHYREQLDVIDRFMKMSELSGRPLHVFKMAPYQILSLPHIICYLLDNNFVFVKLWRENLVQAAVSQIAAQRLQAQTGRANVKHDAERLSRIRVERRQLFSTVRSLSREIDRLNVAASYVDQGRGIAITYESMIADQAGVLRAISELSGVPIEPARSRTRKNLRGCLSESVENYDEMRTWLAGTFLEGFLDEGSLSCDSERSDTAARIVGQVE